MLRCSTRELTPEDAEESARSAGQALAAGNGGLTYEHESLAGRGRDRSRGPRRRDCDRGGSAGAVDAAAAAGGRRAREARPQRPVLVRLGQEVQEVPRRLAAPSPPLADDSIRLDPLDQRYLRDFERLMRDPDVIRNTRVPSRPSTASRRRWLGRYVEGWQDGRVPASRSWLATARSRVRGHRRSRPGRAAGRDRVRRRAGGARPGVAGQALRLVTDWALGELDLERVELRIDVDNEPSIKVAERAGYRREGVLRSLHFKEGIRHGRRPLLTAGPRAGVSVTPRPGWRDVTPPPWVGRPLSPCRRGYPARAHAGVPETCRFGAGADNRPGSPSPRLGLPDGRDTLTSRSTSSSRRSGPSSPGSVITFDPDRLAARAAELEGEMGAPGFWDDQQHAAAVSTEHARVTTPPRPLQAARPASTTTRPSLLGMDGDMADEIVASLLPLRAELDRLEEDALFTGEYDGGDAVVTIHAGAGGTDSQDWAEILLRMYLRWAERRGFADRAARGEPGGGGRAQVGHVHRAGRERLRHLQGRARRPPARAPLAVRPGAPPAHVVRTGDRQPAARRRRRRSRSTRATSASTPTGRAAPAAST